MADTKIDAQAELDEAKIKELEEILNPSETEADDADGIDAEMFTVEERAAMAEDDEDEGVDPDTPFDADADGTVAADADVGEAPEPEEEPKAETVLVAEEYHIPDGVLIGENLQETLAGIKTDTDGLFDQYENGEIDRVEMQEQIDEKNAEATRLQAEAERHIGIQEHRQKQIDKERQVEMDVWKTDVETYFSDFPDLANEANMPAFDHLVRSVAGMHAYKGATNQAVLAAAHDMLSGQKDMLGLTIPARVSKEPDPTPENKDVPNDAANKPKTGKPPIPVTLAKVPQAQITDEGGKFGVLDQILKSEDPYKIEAAMAKLSDDQMEEFGGA